MSLTIFRRTALTLIALALSSHVACAQFMAPDSASTRIGVTGAGTGTTGAVTATLPAAQGKQTFLCGFAIQSIGGTAQVAPTVTGLVGGTLTYTVLNSATVQTLSQTFSPCVPSSAVNTGVVVTSPAAVGATAVNVNAWGYIY